MKLSKNLLLALFIIIITALLAACGDDEGEDGEVKESEYPSTVTIGTASQGGTYYIWGGGIANLLEEQLDVTSNVEVTGGPVNNIQLLDQGDIHIGMVTVGPLYEGYNQAGDWATKKFDGIRVIFPMYHTPFHWWSTEKSGVTSLAEHEGERVGVGPSGGTAGTYNPQIYEALGIETDNQVKAGAGDLADQMMDGQLDHIGFAAGIPIAAVTEIETQADINIYGIEGEERDTVIEKLPFFVEYVIPEDTYDSIDGDIETIAQYNFGVVQQDANAEFVYDFVKAYHENIDDMIATHSSAEEAKDPEAILKNQDYPLHPGAIKYYEEIGIDLPDSVYPPEWEDSEANED